MIESILIRANCTMATMHEQANWLVHIACSLYSCRVPQFFVSQKLTTDANRLSRDAMVTGTFFMRTTAPIVELFCLLISPNIWPQDSISRTNGARSPFTLSGYAEAYYGVDFAKPRWSMLKTLSGFFAHKIKSLPQKPFHVLRCLTALLFQAKVHPVFASTPPGTLSILGIT